MIFTYWQGEPSAVEGFLADWRLIDAEVCAFDDAAVTALVAELFARWRILFERITIPACKSDIARLVLLYKYGGFYLDAHAAPGDRQAIRSLLSCLDRFELVLFLSRPSWLKAEMYVLNGALLGHRGTPVLAFLIEKAFQILLEHCRKEVAADKYVEYNIAAMTGGWLFASQVFELEKHPFPLASVFLGRVHCELVHPTKGHFGFRWYQHYHYRISGQHWSERQKTERLFDVSQKQRIS